MQEGDTVCVILVWVLAMPNSVDKGADAGVPAALGRFRLQLGELLRSTGELCTLQQDLDL